MKSTPHMQVGSQGSNRRVLGRKASPAARIIARPFLKWAGGKQWLSPLCDKLWPPDFTGRYFEPFLGGGSLYLAACPSPAVLADTNSDLMITYRAVRDVVEEVIRQLRSYRYEREFFEATRRSRPRSPVTTACRLIYLNRTAYNGLYRVNLRGEFNVPFGQFRNPTICDAPRLRAAAAALQRVELVCADFEDTTAQAQPGDFVYFDPPYITGHVNNGFLKYNSRLFSWEDQERLARLAAQLRARGVRVLVSNADAPPVSHLYREFHSYRISRRSAIASAVQHRAGAVERLFSSFPLQLPGG